MGEHKSTREQTTLRSSAAHVFVDNLDTPLLSDDDAHHLERVLRLRTDDDITISDGAGRWRVAKAKLRPESFGPIRAVSTPKPALRVGFGLLKGDRNEWVVQKLTELGVDTIIPLGASRSVVNWSADRCHRHHERFVRVAREAAMQSRRVWLPTIAPPTTVGTLVTTTAVSLAEPGGTASLSLDGSAVLVGPEGGWDDGELALSTTWVDLGPSILRAETAAVAVAALLAAMRANLVRPA